MFFPQIGWAQRKEAVIGWSSDEFKEFVPGGENNEFGVRILFLGDSYLAGSGVSNLDERFPSLLETNLNHKVTSRILAAGGWGTDQQLLAFKQKGRFWKPDLVFLAFCSNNDISNILSHNHGPKKIKPYFKIGKNDKLELYNGYGLPINYETIFKIGDRNKKTVQPMRSYLVDYVRHILNSRNSTDQDINFEDFQSVDTRYKKFLFWEEKPEEIYKKLSKLSWAPQKGVNHVSAYIHENFEMNTYQWRLFEFILLDLKKEVESSGGKLVVMLLPVIFNPKDAETIVGGSFSKKFQTPDGYFTFRSVEPRERLRAATERVGAMFFDPTPQFIRHVAGKDRLELIWPDPNDRHFSEVGHEILANLVKEFLRVILNEGQGSSEYFLSPDYQKKI